MRNLLFLLVLVSFVSKAANPSSTDQTQYKTVYTNDSHGTPRFRQEPIKPRETEAPADRSSARQYSVYDYINQYQADLAQTLNNEKAQSPNKQAGLGLYNGISKVWENNTRLSRSAYYFSSGQDILVGLQQYTKKFGCVSKLTVASHGWTKKNPYGGEGIPISNGPNGSGLYLDDESRMQRGNSERGMSLDDLEYALRPHRQKGFTGLFKRKVTDIKFCDACLVQIMGCNTGDKFATKFSQVSGCQVVYSTGSSTAVDTKDGSKDHIWNSEKQANSKRSGNFMKITPVKDQKGQVAKTLRQDIGPKYISQ
jgi:hypothetical protein